MATSAPKRLGPETMASKKIALIRVIIGQGTQQFLCPNIIWHRDSRWRYACAPNRVTRQNFAISTENPDWHRSELIEIDRARRRARRHTHLRTVFTRIHLAQ